MSLDGKVALVTGGAGGIGRATCAALAQRGVSLVVADIDGDAAADVAAAHGGVSIRCDVSVLEQNAAAVALAVEHFGGLDLAFLNAGVATGCGVGEDFDLALYRRAMGANLDGVVFGTNAALPAMKARGGGGIVATASLAGLTGVPMDPLYSANKHAVVGLARSLGPVLELDGVRFNAVCPGYAESGIVAPMRDALTDAGFEIMPAERVAEAVVGLFEGDAAGVCWFVQPGRQGAFGFRHVPGPRKQEAAP